MISVCVRKDGIKVTGHAHYAEPGKDIVCAAVTALSQTLACSLDALTSDDISVISQKGWLQILYDFKSLSETAKNLIDSFFIGICLIIDEFPDNVRLA